MSGWDTIKFLLSGSAGKFGGKPLCKLIQVINKIPGNPFRGANAIQDAFAHLKQYHGLDQKAASNRLHVLKDQAGLGPADNVIIGRIGDV